MASRTRGAITTLRDVRIDHFRHERRDRGAHAMIRIHGARDAIAHPDSQDFALAKAHIAAMKVAPAFAAHRDRAQNLLDELK